MGRMDRVNETMRREISTMLQQDFQDPRLMLVTILHVDVSPDLHLATVYYSVLGDEQKTLEISQTLDKIAGYVRRLIGERVRLRYTPEIVFRYDSSIRDSARIEQALEEIKKTMPFDQGQGGGAS